MDHYFQRRASLISPYQAYASQLQYQQYQLRSSQYGTDVPYYGLDRRPIQRGGRSIEGFGALPPPGLIPHGLREHQQRAAVVSRPLNLDVHASLRGRLLPLEGRNRLSRTDSQAKRTRNADDRQAPKKKPRKAQEGKKDPEKEAQQERAKEVIMLHKLWKSGKKDVSAKEEAEDKKPPPQSAGGKKNKGKHRNKNHKNDSSAKPADKSAKDATSTWEDVSGPGPDPKNASWEQEPKREGESQKDDWATASQPGSENGNRVSTATENQEKSEIEQEKLHHLVDLQKAALKAVSEFLGNESDIDDSDDDLDEEMEDVEYPVTGVETDQKSEVVARSPEHTKGREEKAFDFFVSLFNENQELRKAYEECCNCGTFECFVCSGSGSKLGKKFPDLVGLVQHARKILKTKRRPEHRGYGRAVCALLGWDPSRDPVPARTVTIRPRGCIPPPGDELQDNEEAGPEKTEVTYGKSEVKDETKNDVEGFKAKEDNVIVIADEPVVDVASARGMAPVGEERNDAVKGEDGEDGKDDAATDDEGSDIEEAGSLHDDKLDNVIAVASSG